MATNFPPYQTPIAGALQVTREWLLYFRGQNSGGGAPTDAPYVVSAPTPTLTNARVATDSGSITVDTSVSGQISWHTVGTQILTVTKTIVDADIKKLPGTPVVVLAGPASGQRHKLIGGSLRAHIVTGYAGLDASFCALVAASLGSGDWVTTAVADDSSTSPAITHLTVFITGAGTDGIVDLIPYQEVAIGTLPFTGYVNVYPEDTASWDAADWTCILDNNGSTADLTGGNAANFLLITLYYVLEALN